MIDNNNILLITDNSDVIKLITEKLVLLRSNDKISVCKPNGIKKVLTNSLYSVIILHQSDSDDETLKYISNIKTIKPKSEIILLLNEENPQLVINAYDNGIYDYFYTDSPDYEMLIKSVNCFKKQVSKDINTRNEKFLEQLGVINSKTGLYKSKYLKEIFTDLADNLKIQSGILAIITLDNSVNTKVSSNRLALCIKSGVRGDDIIAEGRSGTYYIILPNVNISGANKLLQKIQTKMGKDFPIRAGLAKIGLETFETIEKNAKDGLVCALQKEQLSICLENNNKPDDNWLDDEGYNNLETEKKDYKLFKKIYDNKMETVITPIFFRYQKELETKLKDCEISQYSNKIESVFCIKNNKHMSELIVRYNGYAKFRLEINHSGLYTPENFEDEIPLKSMNEKYLSSHLKRLKNEFNESIKSEEGALHG